MTTLRQAAQQALEALERYSGVDQRACDAEDALRQAIEQAEKQEPKCVVILEVFGKDWRLDYMSLPVGKHKLYTQQYVYTTPPAAQQEPTPWRDMIVASLVREGVNKHRARELADHFAAQPEQEPVAYYHPRNGFYWAKPTSIFAPTVVDVPPMPLYAAPPAAQRPWQGLTEFQFAEIYNKWNDTNGSTAWGLNQALEAKLRKLNT